MTPFAAMADGRAVIFYDQLDSGNSDHRGNPANWTVERFESEIDSVRQALSLDKVVLAGHSMGTSWIVDYAATHPNGLEAIILGSPFVRTRDWSDDARQYRKPLPESVQKTLTKYEDLREFDNPEYIKAVDIYNGIHFCTASCSMPDTVDAPPTGTICSSTCGEGRMWW